MRSPRFETISYQVYASWFSDRDICIPIDSKITVVLKKAWWASPPGHLRREVWVFYTDSPDSPAHTTRALNLYEALEFIRNEFFL